MIERVLTENGFTEKEAKIYLAALEFGEASMSQLASKTHLKRPTIYDLVDGLKRRGLVSVGRRRGIQYISALSPRVLVDRFKTSVSLAEESLPMLLEMAYASPLKPRIRSFEGLEGLKQILREFSYSQEPTMGFTDYEQMPKELFQFIRKEVVARRKKLQNPVRLIVPHNEINLKIKNEDHLHYGEHRAVTFPQKKNPMEILLFETSKVAFLSFTPSELFGLIIDSVAIHQTLKNLFLLVWEIAK